MTCVQISCWAVRGAVGAALAVAAACGGSSSAPTVPDPPQPPPPPPGPCVAAASCSARLSLGAGAFLPYYATHRLDEGDTAHPATRAVVVVHGNSRNADDYFERTVAAAELAGRLQSSVVVAPRFQTSDDGPGAGEPYWSSPGWKRGHLSQGGASPAVSSYAAIDTVLARLADETRFPALTRVVVTGHSAGGQVAHRYAAGSPMEERLAGLGVTVRYVVANPSTYLYPTPLREWAGQYVTPDSESCPDYDDWHYGLQDLPAYMLREGPDSARTRLLRRDAVVLAGDQDTGTTLLDQSCGANFQGANRFQRAQALVRTLDHVFPAEHRHRLVVVPGVGHSSTEMYQSPLGRRALFEP